MKIKFIFLILLSALTINSLNAQKSNKKITITGTVLNSDKEPIVNAIILIDDVKTSSMTDAAGKYKVKVKADAMKIGFFTFGHGTFEDSIKGRTQIDINFGVSRAQQTTDQDVAPGEQGVNTGYGLVKKKNLTTDVNSIDGTNKKYASYHSLSELVQREGGAGVRVNGNAVIIQDSKDLFGTVYALIVVDGVYMDGLPDIQPAQVKSIEILKSTAAAMYGSRGYGGAVIIKTKIQND